MFSPRGAPIAFFARIARKAEETLESIAAPKQSHVNDNSFKLDTKLTAPAESEITAPMCVPRLPIATGTSFL